ncbi:hypothetical protein [Nonomuraea salmonea]|uniref:hypothetical protein n=1 Tax=Nonomuraea salmonea TaxID=46181 RepID=UPI0031E89CDE
MKTISGWGDGGVPGDGVGRGRVQGGVPHEHLAEAAAGEEEAEHRLQRPQDAVEGDLHPSLAGLGALGAR